MKASTFCLKTWKTRQQWEVCSVHCTAEPQPLLFFSVCSTVVETHNWRKIYPSYSGEWKWSMYCIFFCLWRIPFWNGLKEFIPLQFLSGISFKCLNVGICIFIPGFINMKQSQGSTSNIRGNKVVGGHSHSWELLPSNCHPGETCNSQTNVFWRFGNILWKFMCNKKFPQCCSHRLKE